MESSAKTEGSANPRGRRGTAGDVSIPAKARRAGCSPAACELLGIILAEKRRRKGKAVVPSLERLAKLQGCSPRTVQRRLAQLAGAGLLWTVYRGGQGLRPLYYVARPSEVPEGFKIQRGAPENFSPYPDNFVGVKPGPYLISGKTNSDTTFGVPAEAGDREQATSAPKADAPPLAARWVFALWLRVWSQLHGGQAYERHALDGAAAERIGASWAGHPAGSRGLTYFLARWIRSGEGGDRGSPLWLVPSAAPSDAPAGWSSATLRVHQRALADAPAGRVSPARAGSAGERPSAEHRAELRRLFGGSW
mgnify:CR=1 FL=1